MNRTGGGRMQDGDPPGRTTHAAIDVMSVGVGAVGADEVAGQDGLPPGRFQARSGRRVACMTCGSTPSVEQMSADSATVVDGVTWSHVRKVVVSLRCLVCGAHGCLILDAGTDGSADAQAARAFGRWHR